jgi:hypothetical protein
MINAQQSIFLYKRDPMTNLSTVVAQLKVERAKLDRAIEALSGNTTRNGAGRRKLSVAARRRIAAAQRARWAKVKGKKAA